VSHVQFYLKLVNVVRINCHKCCKGQNNLIQVAQYNEKSDSSMERAMKVAPRELLLAERFQLVQQYNRCIRAKICTAKVRLVAWNTRVNYLVQYNGAIPVARYCFSDVVCISRFRLHSISLVYRHI
jgi:hypothetical protein